MFSRQATPPKSEHHPVHANAVREQPPPPIPAATPVAIEITPPPADSVIGQDLKILGGGLRLISEGNLTVDGIVEGDVLGANVIIGKHGQVNGLVHGETVSIHGQVSGMVRAVDVSLKCGANVEAEVHHNTLSLELGANFEGRSRRYLEREELIPDLVRAATEGRLEHSPRQPGPAPLTSQG
ncbi:MAG: polymer-forming cytoskeletal protein [Alphaproteobacteria bacterium]|nr:polymer-forming cytoskeletal protein [Alphaproteobacteria bacterium]